MIPDWVSEYVGLPFEWNGYSRDGIGCWGLVALVLSEQYGIEVPRHDDIAELMAEGAEVQVPTVQGWSQVGLPQAQGGDLLHMRGVTDGRIHPMHIGIVVALGHAIHIEKDVGSCMIDYRIKKHAWRVIGAYRHA